MVVPVVDTLDLGNVENLLSEEATLELAMQFEQMMADNPSVVAEHSLGRFCAYYLAEHFDQGFGKFQYEIFELLENLRPGKHVEILFPREHGKSTLFTFAFVLWCICYRKKKHIILPSAVRETAEKFLANIKNELLQNPLIRRDFGDLVGEDEKGGRPWRSQYIKTTNFVVVRVSSTGATIRGAVEALPEDLDADYLGEDEKGRPQYRLKSIRPDLILCDDIIDDKRILTKEVRDRVWNWFWMNLFSAQQMDTGNIIIVGTTLHDDDLVMRLYKDAVQTTDWMKLMLPAANPDRPFDEDGNPIDCLFPEKWARIDYHRPVLVTDSITGAQSYKYYSYLWWRAKELGPAFGPEFLMKPVDDATRYFNRSDFGYYVVKTPFLDPTLFDTYFRTTSRMLEYLPADMICVTTVDPAGTDEKALRIATSDPDYTVVMTTGFSPTTKKFYLIAVNRMRCSPGDMLRSVLVHLQMFDRKYGGKYIPDPQAPHDYVSGFPFFHLGVGIESVAFQKVLAPMLEELSQALGMYPLVMELPRGDRRGKRMRAMLPATLSQNQLLMFPYPAPGLTSKDVEETIEELATFPQADSHDDCVDAFTDGVHILHSYSLQLGRGLMGMDAVRALISGDYGFRTSTARLEDILAGMEGTGVRPFEAAIPTPVAGFDPTIR